MPRQGIYESPIHRAILCAGVHPQTQTQKAQSPNPKPRPLNPKPQKAQTPKARKPNGRLGPSLRSPHPRPKRITGSRRCNDPYLGSLGKVNTGLGQGCFGTLDGRESSLNLHILCLSTKLCRDRSSSSSNRSNRSSRGQQF